MSRFNRLATFFWSLLLCLSLFACSLSVSAASYVEVSQNMEDDWVHSYSSSGLDQTVIVDYNNTTEENNITYAADGQNLGVFLQYYDLPTLVPGDSYKFSFRGKNGELGGASIRFGLGDRTSASGITFIKSYTGYTYDNTVTFTIPADYTQLCLIIEIYKISSVQTLGHLTIYDISLQNLSAPDYSGITGWFQLHLVNPLSGWFSSLASSFTSSISNLSTWFDNHLVQPLSEWFSSLQDRLYSIFYSSYWSYPEWSVGWVQNNGVVDVNSTVGAYTTGYIDCRTDFGFITMDFSDATYNYLRVFRYSLSDHVYIDSNSYTSTSTWPVILPSGYSYIVCCRMTSFDDDDVEALNDVVKIWSDVNVFRKLVYQTRDGLISLFVPEDGYFESFKDQFSDVAEDKLGFVYQVGDFVSLTLGGVRDLLSDTSGDFVFVLPELEFEFLDFDIHLWDDIEINFTEVLDGDNWFSFLYEIYSIVVQCFFIILLIEYADKLFKEVFKS